MSSEFDWLSLGEEERIVWSGQPRLRAILTGSIVLAGIALAAFVYEPVPWGVAVLIVGLLILGYGYLVLSNIDYVLTTQTLYKRRGVFGERVQELPLSKIQNTDLRKGIMGTQLGYGDVMASSAGGANQVSVSFIETPEVCRDHLDEQRRRYQGRDDGVGGGRGRGDRGVDEEAIADVMDEARALRQAAEALEEVVG